jgi:alkylhydroperoxidase/carboxymuconolactone decarboxylase family protein YurZ
MDDKELRRKTADTATLYFEGIDGETPYALWKAFDPGLARDLSLFITGRMYAREKLPHPTRQLVTVAALTVLGKPDELKLHLQAALNVGCPVEDITETIFQTMVYGGVPAGNQALGVFREVLEARGMWPPDNQTSTGA